MTNEDPLAALRREIDRLDDSILKLIEQRMGAAREIAELKRNETTNRLRLRPAREAAVVGRLVAQTGPSTEKLVRQVWREIMACSLDLQAPTDLLLYAEKRPSALTDATRRRFGCVGKMHVVASPADALEGARTLEAVAVIELGATSDWWTALKDDPQLAAFDCLRDDEGRAIALAVGRISEEDLQACPHIGIVETSQAQGETLASARGLALVLA